VVILEALLFECVLLLAALLGLGAWQRDPSTTGRLTFVALCISVACMTLGDLMALRGLASEVVADRFKYAGILTLPALWMGFAAHAAHLDLARRLPWFPLLLLIPSLGLFALMFEPRYGMVFHRTLEGADDLRGPLWWVNAVYGQGLALCGSSILAFTAFRGGSRGQVTRRLVLVAASVLPVLGNAAYIALEFSWPYDPTAPLLGFSLLAMRSAVFGGNLLEPLPIPQRDVIHQLPLGVILTDNHDHVVEMSDAAAARLGVFESFALGRSLDEVMAWSEPTPFSSTEIRRRGVVAGRLILLEGP
jgi:PAS domain-containing protein